MQRFVVMHIQEPQDSKTVLADHVEAITVTEDNISPMMGWRSNRTEHEIRKAMYRANKNGKPLIAVVMRIAKMN